MKIIKTKSLEAVYTSSLKNKGITLVALVVTIVVLLILAGVSINLVLGENGLITKAQEAKRKTAEAKENEITSMDSASDWVSETVNNTSLPQNTITKPYMPSSEFKKVEGTNLANGLVIEDASDNQYVWVEVPMTTEVYPTVGVNITEFNSDIYTKIENDLHKYTMTYRKGKNETETTYKDEYYEDSADEWFKSTEEYNIKKYKMLKSIYQNGGFWVGRYEAGIENNRKSPTEEITVTPKSKEGLYPYNYITRAQAKKLAEQVVYDEYSGSLMFGVQWDLMLKFIENKKINEDTAIIEKLNNDSTLIGNNRNNLWNIANPEVKYSTNIGISFNNCPYQKDEEDDVILTTGADKKFSLMNIYDISGNMWEWTLEQVSGESDMCCNRGGGFWRSGLGYPALYRGSTSITDSGDSIGFRITLY